MWKVKSKVVPVVIGALGAVILKLEEEWFQQIGFYGWAAPVGVICMWPYSV